MWTRRGFAEIGVAALAGRMLPEMAYAQRAAVGGKMPKDTVWLNANEQDQAVNCEIVKTVHVTAAQAAADDD